MATTIPASFLSDPKANYKFDFVVATTQASINAAMKTFLAQLTEPEVTVCYVANAKNQPVQIDYQTLVKNAKGSDPFSIPATADPDTDPDLQNLFKARFMEAFRIKLGIPQVPPAQLANLPNIVTLSGGAESVTFNMLCAEFIVCQYTPPGGYSSGTWAIESQPTDNVADLWVFSSKVDLRLTQAGDYSKLPADVRAQINNLGSQAFSVQQLLFDLSNAGLQTTPKMPANIGEGTAVYSVLNGTFMDSYFKAMQANGQPFIGCAIVKNTPDPSTLQLTAFNFEVDPLLQSNGTAYPNPTLAQQDLTTLNYLCAANGNTLGSAVAFPWNWVGSSAANADHDGVVSINRNTLAKYFEGQLTTYVKNNCILPHVTTTMDGLEVDYSWQLTPGQNPNTITIPPTGQTVLTYDYTASSHDVAGLNGDEGELTMTDTFHLDVQFTETTAGVAQIIVTQHQVIYSYVRLELTSGSGNIVDVQIVDTYTIDVNVSGKLEATVKSVKTDNSYSPSVNSALNFFTNLNSLLNTATQYARTVANTTLTDMPLSVIQNFVFPGGKTFVFKTASFSPNQDLVSYISYAS